MISRISKRKRNTFMNVPFTMMSRREALATLGSAGLGLLAMRLSPVHADDVKENALSTALSKFTEKSRQRLLRVLREPGFSGYIPSAEVKDLCDGEGKSIAALILELLPLPRTPSRPPIPPYYARAVALAIGSN